MEHTRSRRALIAIDGFAGVSALLGMAILLLDWPIQSPVGWLQRTPFGDYTVPAVILGLVVGEIVLLDRAMPAATYWAQAEYLLVGLAMVALALRVASDGVRGMLAHPHRSARIRPSASSPPVA